MTSIYTITRYLNKLLDIRSFKDSSKNGLQIRSKKDITSIGFAVDACLSTFKKARSKGIDLLITHHGILWKSQRDTSGLKRSRMSFLKKNKISLYACHLPLDAHPIYGNNIQIAKLLDLKDIKRFGRYKNKLIGFQGTLPNPKTMSSLRQKLDNILNTRCTAFSFHKNKIKNISIISGSGFDEIKESYKKGLDCHITGDITNKSFNISKDLRHNVIKAGHYATETVGLRSLMPLIRQKFNIKTTFIDNPTGL